MAESFPVYSANPDLDDRDITRLIKVMQRVERRQKRLKSAAVFACRFTAGTKLYSAHAFRKAVDFMLRTRLISEEEGEKLGRSIVRQCTKRTLANRGRPVTGIIFVIGGKRQWNRKNEREFTESAYDGVSHNNHAHAATMGSTTKKPECAR